MRNAAIGLLENLDRGRLVMSAPVRVVVVLIGVEIASWLFSVEPACFADRADGPYLWLVDHEFGTERGKGAQVSGGDVTWNTQLQAIAAGRRNHRVGYPRVT